MSRRILHLVAEILWFCILSGLAFAQLQQPLPKLNYDMTADFFQLPAGEHLVEPAGIEDAVLKRLAHVELSDEELGIAEATLAERLAELEQRRTQTKNTLRLQYDQLRNRISKLADLLLDGAIEKSLFASKQRALLQEQAAVEEKLKEFENGSDAGIAQLEKTVELAKDASFLYKTASVENKRKLLRILLSNLTVSGKNVEMTLTIPFRVIAEREKNDDGRLNRGTCRTWTQITKQLHSYFNENLTARSES